MRHIRKDSRRLLNLRQEFQGGPQPIRNHLKLKQGFNVFSRIWKIGTITLSILISEDNQAPEKSQIRRQMFLRSPIKDDTAFSYKRSVGGGLGNRKSWHKVSESRVKANMKNPKSESRIIKHNVEKSEQLILEGNNQEDKPLESGRGTDQKVAEVETILLPFGSQDSKYSLGDAFQRQVSLDGIDGKKVSTEECGPEKTNLSNVNKQYAGSGKLTCDYSQRSPEFVSHDVVYHVFYQDEPLDIIESLLAAKHSDPSQNITKEKSGGYDVPGSSRDLWGTYEAAAEQSNLSHSDHQGILEEERRPIKQEFALLEQEVEESRVEAPNSFQEGICEEIHVNMPSLEDTPCRNHFRARWETQGFSSPRTFKKQEEIVSSLSFAQIGSKMPSDLLTVNIEQADTSRISNEESESPAFHRKTIRDMDEICLSSEPENIEQPLLQLINARLQVLSASKLKYLLSIMNKLETEEVSGLTPVTLKEQTPNPQLADELVGCKNNTVSLRILSTWGDTKSVGLVEVDLFDSEGKKIQVLPTQILLKAEGLPQNISTISRIINGVVTTTNEKHMWESSLPSPGSSPLEICIQLPSKETDVGHLEVWNYKGSVTKGVREMQVLVNGQLAWQGTISKACANQVYDSCTKISLMEEPASSSADKFQQQCHGSSLKLSTSVSDLGAQHKLNDEYSQNLDLATRHDTQKTMEECVLSTQAQEDSRMKNISIWSMTAHYQDDLVRRPDEEVKDVDYHLKPDMEKFDDSMDFQEIERYITAEREEESTLYTNYETENEQLSRQKLCENLVNDADVRYEMFAVDKLQETAEECALLQALDYAKPKKSTQSEKPEMAGVDAASGIADLVTFAKATKDFCIPMLPHGNKLTISIHSTWGDPHYVGLSGIEVFDDSGQLLHFNARKQIQVNVANTSLLSGFYGNPYLAERLVDDVNMTCDDSHMWVAPFSLGQSCSITISLERATTVGMIRFWNYNKSIIHSFRGARMITIFLDSRLIFSGELRKASGLLSDAFDHAESILFTETEVALSSIELYDVQYYRKVESAQDRPRHDASCINGYSRMTGSAKSSPQGLLANLEGQPSQSRRMDEVLLERLNSDKAPIGRVLKLKLLRSWGDSYYFGLTGIQVLDEDGVAQSIQSDLITAKPRDLNDIPGHKGDYRTLDKLVDGCNVTTDDRHMWLVPYDGPEAEHFLEIDFKSPTTMAALRIWNYNKSLDDSFRGVKWIQVFVDDTEISPFGCILLRKAPGTDKFDFGQVLPLCKRSKRNLQQLDKHKVREKAKLRRIHSDMVHQEYLTPLLPSGHMVKFALLSTWGDHQYVGLNGLELYDELGQVITISNHNVHVLPDMSTHFSNPEKLFNGVNNTWDAQNMWLSVRDYSNGNYIHLYFDEPIMLSYIRIWNFSRNPMFGVREVEIFLDDLLIFKGYVRKANSKHLSDPQSIIFTNDEKIVLANEDKIYYCGGFPNRDVILINDNYVVSETQPTTYSCLL